MEALEPASCFVCPGQRPVACDWISFLDDRDCHCKPERERQTPRCDIVEVLAQMIVASLEQLSGRASDFAEFVPSL